MTSDTSHFANRVAGLILLVVLAGAASAGEPKQAGTVALSLSGGNVPPGGIIALHLELGDSGASPETLIVKLAFDTARLSVADAESYATGKTFDFRQTDSGFASILYGGAGIEPGPVATVYLEASPGAATGPVVITGTNSSAADTTPEALPVALTIQPLAIAPLATPHSADTSANGRIELSELLRVIQLYNAGGFACDAVTEDGYTPMGNDRTCPPHRLDYAEQDWRFDLGELLRCIQFFNAFGGAYHADSDGEDGFAAGLEQP